MLINDLSHESISTISITLNYVAYDLLVVVFISYGLHYLVMVEDNLHGPTVLWGQLKGKKAKSNDGKDLGDIDKISQNYIRLEKGTIKKEKFWVPKYLADAFDGNVTSPRVAVGKKSVQSSSMVKSREQNRTTKTSVHSRLHPMAKIELGMLRK